MSLQIIILPNEKLQTFTLKICKYKYKYKYDPKYYEHNQCTPSTLIYVLLYTYIWYQNLFPRARS